MFEVLMVLGLVILGITIDTIRDHIRLQRINASFRAAQAKEAALRRQFPTVFSTDQEVVS